MQILGVGILDVEMFGRDILFVQVNETGVMCYEVHRDGRIEAMQPEPEPLQNFRLNVEKFGHCYLLDEPIPIKKLSDLPAYLGTFEPISELYCRHRDCA